MKTVSLPPVEELTLRPYFNRHRYQNLRFLCSLYFGSIKKERWTLKDGTQLKFQRDIHEKAIATQTAQKQIQQLQQWQLIKKQKQIILH